MQERIWYRIRNLIYKRSKLMVFSYLIHLFWNIIRFIEIIRNNICCIQSYATVFIQFLNDSPLPIIICEHNSRFL